MQTRRPRCELCRLPAAWSVQSAGGMTAAVCDSHRHAAGPASEFVPLIQGPRPGPEPLGAITDRLLRGEGLGRGFRRRRFQPDL